ncbi:MAG: sugar ABC transporter permease [Chloroflexi bacterium HGW-Chloroflexi-5]|jgi:multiple sugar transport system permease protein|nr:MAG: sugar ABC transporter permease [Chloroflexi bacterium HGW-Chloroflexi-5]
MNSLVKFFRQYAKHYVLLLPFFILFAIFYFYPLVYSVVISLTKWDGIHTPVFVDVQNYLRIVNQPRFSTSMLNLGRFVLIVVPLGITIALALAFLVDSFTPRWEKFFRGMYFFPVIIPMFLSAAIFRYLLSPKVGLLPLGLEALGITGINWLSNPTFMVPAVGLVDMWRAIGFNFLLFFAGLKAIPKEYFEAARVDGANRWQEIFHIAIPQLEPVLFLVIVNGFIGALQAFDIPWLLSLSTFVNYGGTRNGMLFPVMEIYMAAWGRQDFGGASAFAVILLLITLVITVIQFAWRKHRLAN